MEELSFSAPLHGRIPLVIEPTGRSIELAGLVRRFHDAIDKLLLDSPALLFRGFRIASVHDFSEVVDAFKWPTLDYVYRSTPRTTLTRGIFTASEYPSTSAIPLHNENSYQRSWPRKISFACLKPASVGGETTIADMRLVTSNINTSVLARFERSQVKYIRHFHPHVDLSWKVVFQADSKEEVSAYCASKGIYHEWLDSETLRTIQTCRAVTHHPITGEKFWFNQAHLFHVSSLGGVAEKAMRQVFGADKLPRHVCFGDDGEISDADLRTVRESFERNMIKVEWRAGDVLLLDNVQVAHGRQPYKGERSVIASLMEPSEAYENL